MKQSPRWDVLVVGLGPAGAAAALKLARAGVKVVAIDKAVLSQIKNSNCSVRVLGAKPCAGGLTRSAWPFAVGLDLELDRHVQRFRQLGVRTSLGRTWIREKEPLLATVDRVAWSAKIVELLTANGVEVRLGTRLVSFEVRGDLQLGSGASSPCPAHLRHGSTSQTVLGHSEDAPKPDSHCMLELGSFNSDLRARTDNGDLACDFIVGADGAGSRVRRLLGLPSAAHTVGWQLRVPLEAVEKRFDRPFVWFSPRRLGVGYGWVFPATGEIRVGVGGPRDCGVSWKKELLNFAQSLGFDSSKGVVECAGIGTDYQGHRFGRVFLAGDAAGLASPLTGEGIHEALMSGKEVAAEIIKDGYRSKVIPSLARRHRRTLTTLTPASIHGTLYALAPWILKVPAVRRETMARYIY